MSEGVEVELRTVEASPTAVVAQVTTWAEFPQVWGTLLDQVYDFVRAGGTTQTGHNVMLYLSDRPDVEVGVQVDGPFTPSGRVVPSELPGGRVATAVHRGSYHELGRTHAAVRDWCAANDVDLTSTRWEIYGDWRDDPSELETEVNYLLR